MKIQLSPTRIVKDALTVWSEHGPEVDMVMDLKNLTFQPGSLEAIYTFHVLDHLFPEEVLPALSNWSKCLQENKSVFVVVDDFEYIARAFVGNDISVEILNDLHNHPTQFTRDSLAGALIKAGFPADKTSIWFQDVPDLFKRRHFELVIQATKNHG